MGPAYRHAHREVDAGVDGSGLAGSAIGSEVDAHDASAVGLRSAVGQRGAAMEMDVREVGRSVVGEREPERVVAVRVHSDLAQVLARDGPRGRQLLAGSAEERDRRVTDGAGDGPAGTDAIEAMPSGNGSIDKLPWKKTEVWSLPAG